LIAVLRRDHSEKSWQLPQNAEFGDIGTEMPVTGCREGESKIADMPAIACSIERLRYEINLLFMLLFKPILDRCGLFTAHKRG